MREQKQAKKNHWTQAKVDMATKKINQDIYERNRQAPIHIKIDDMSIYINDRITRRGIAKGLVSIQEDLNRNLLEVDVDLRFNLYKNSLILSNKKSKK